ncbi:hypothetical protein ACTNBL_03950 [Enterococcus villorum]|jgi:hypothetical protein|uniref:Uncharacterized protein n=2 Tax=Enterococcus villorum TaxID=112904 RepID=A0A511IZD3_9ENTE|nr:hypothetical protein [Enterococcus villorum]EOH89270.1 hypothetical protein UAO_01539 [Enterococcus villorum ATCC 700913]EOW76078.1 hypothetical protein I591_01378 [Enterococcus villorum ATCC 700913]GEL91132.1 hypothetical protein EVI01_04690 [Enterococcus villorum]
MPFIVYFFILLLTLYIPLPTALLFFHRLSDHHDTMTLTMKLFLLFLVYWDYKFSFYCIYNCKLNKRSYLYLSFINLVELGIHIFLLFTYKTIGLSIICLSQLLLLICMFTFPLSKKFRQTLFH